jgi:GT2 family glycosyltransferase
LCHLLALLFLALNLVIALPSLADRTENLRPPRISLVIPVHNGGHMFAQCLRAVQAADPPPDELIVVADGDTDGSGDLAEKFGAKVIRTPSPRGPATARNIGANTALGGLILFVDADVVLRPSTIAVVTAFFRDNPGIDAIFGSYDDDPSERNFLSQYKNLFHHYVHQTAKEDAATFWGACGAIRREVFMAVGGFDEKYHRPCIEDIDLGYRLRRAGFRIYLLKALQVKHLKRWGVFSLLRADFVYRALPWTRLILAEGRLLNDLNLKTSNRISAALVLGLLFGLCASIWIPWLLVPCLCLVLLLLALNWDLYHFFKARRGLAFSVKTIPWHWFYYFYSSLAFALGFADHNIKRFSRRSTKERETKRS